MSATASPPEDTGKPTTATIIYPGAPGRASIELRILPDGSNEAYLVPSGAAPIPTGISLIADKGKYYINCRKRKKRILFKPEEVVRQKVLGMLIDDFGYPEDHIELEVGVQMGSSIHEKPADIIVYGDSSKSQAWLIVETKKPNRKDGVEQLKSYMNPTGAPFRYWTNGKWLLEFEPALPRTRDQLTGWTGSADMRRQVRLQFDTLEEAIAYADRQGFTYTVQMPHRVKRRSKSYADNFRFRRPA